MRLPPSDRMKIIGMLMAAMFLLMVPVISQADTITFELNLNNIGLTGGPWAFVTLTDVTASDGRDGVHFYVDPIDTAFLNKTGNFGLKAFYFNEGTSFGGSLSVENFIPTSWNSTYSPSGIGGTGPYGKFEFREKQGTGNVPGNPLQFDVFAPTGSTVTIADFSTILSTEGYIFAAHIAGFYMNGENSGKFSMIPEPGTLVLLGSGLLGLGLTGARKKFRN